MHFCNKFLASFDFPVLLEGLHNLRSDWIPWTYPRNPHFSQVHSHCGLSYDKFTVIYKASSPHSAIYYFLFQFPKFSLILISSSSCLHLLPLTSVLPSVFPSITCFRRQFLYKMWPIQLAFLIFTVCGIFFSWLSSNTSQYYLALNVVSSNCKFYPR